MPNPADGGTAAYQGNFTVGITVAGFDLNQNSYNETNTVNATVRPIPWANPPSGSLYAIVIQVGGLQPRTRHYKVTVYTEAAYIALRSLVGQLGTVLTPRESAQPCLLNSVQRGDKQDISSAIGAQTVDLEFTMVS